MAKSESMRDRVRDAIYEVLERHGYVLPGVSDLAAGAAIREMREPAGEMIIAAVELSPGSYMEETVADIYRTMLAAALEPLSGEER